MFLVLLVLLNLKLGSTDISLREIADVLGRGFSGAGDAGGAGSGVTGGGSAGAGSGIVSGSGDSGAYGSAAISMNYDIIWNIRLPRILAGVMLGGALAISG